MAKQPVLIDSGFLFGLFSVTAPKHRSAIGAISDNRIAPLIPQVSLSEVAYLFRRAGGVTATVSFLAALSIFPENLFRLSVAT